MNSLLGAVIDVELTLNRFGFFRIAPNKFQFACFRLSIWRGLSKTALSFEINWSHKGN